MSKQKYSIWARMAFIVGILQVIVYLLGFRLFWLATSLAIIYGVIALIQIKGNKNLKGKALAWWAIGLSILVIILSVFFFNKIVN